MASFLHTVESFTFRKRPGLYLAFSWVLGLGVGGLAFRYAGNSIVSLMPLAAAGQPSIVSLFLSTCVPFLVSAFAVYISRPGLLAVVGFCRAFAYAYVVCAVLAAFDQGGWLIRWLLLFTDTIGITLLYGYARRHISGLRRFSALGLGCCLFIVAVAIFLDFSCISPFLRQLLL